MAGDTLLDRILEALREHNQAQIRCDPDRSQYAYLRRHITLTANNDGSDSGRQGLW